MNNTKNDILCEKRYLTWSLIVFYTSFYVNGQCKFIFAKKTQYLIQNKQKAPFWKSNYTFVTCLSEFARHWHESNELLYFGLSEACVKLLILSESFSLNFSMIYEGNKFFLVLIWELLGISVIYSMRIWWFLTEHGLPVYLTLFLLEDDTSQSVHDMPVLELVKQVYLPGNFESGLGRKIARVAGTFLRFYWLPESSNHSKSTRYLLFSNSSGHLTRVHCYWLCNVRFLRCWS